MRYHFKDATYDTYSLGIFGFVICFLLSEQALGETRNLDFSRVALLSAFFSWRSHPSLYLLLSTS